MRRNVGFVFVTTVLVAAIIGTSSWFHNVNEQHLRRIEVLEAQSQYLAERLEERLAWTYQEFEETQADTSRNSSQIKELDTTAVELEENQRVLYEFLIVGGDVVGREVDEGGVIGLLTQRIVNLEEGLEALVHLLITGDDSGESGDGILAVIDQRLDALETVFRQR